MAIGRRWGQDFARPQVRFFHVNGIGRLTQITAAGHSTTYTYAPRGRLLSETRVIHHVPYTTSYTYDQAGHLSSMTTPTGRQLSYLRDALGRILQIDTLKDGIATTLVRQITYHPFGGVRGFVNGANVPVSRPQDLNGRPASITPANSFQALQYDAASRITGLFDSATALHNQLYGYDDLDRLTSYRGSGGSQALTYDATGNRTSHTIGVVTTNYQTSPSSNRLTQITGGTTKSYHYDANGSTTSAGAQQFQYDVRGRLVAAMTVLGQVQYQINTQGQRIAKTTATGSTVYHYDSNGKLIGETGSNHLPPR